MLYIRAHSVFSRTVFLDEFLLILPAHVIILGVPGHDLRIEARSEVRRDQALVEVRESRALTHSMTVHAAADTVHIVRLVCRHHPAHVFPIAILMIAPFLVGGVIAHRTWHDHK